MKFGNKYKNACHTYYKYLNSNNHLSESSQMQILTYNHNGASLSYDEPYPILRWIFDVPGSRHEMELDGKMDLDIHLWKQMLTQDGMISAD